MMHHSTILIVGAGPVGMTLALRLSQFGVSSTVVERNATTTQHPKMDLTNGRSMELFASLGLEAELRSAGVASHERLDVVWGTRLTGHVLHRFDYPSPDEQAARAKARNDGLATAVPPMRVSQVVLEPVLRAALERDPLIDLRFGHRLDAIDHTASGVRARIFGPTGESTYFNADYLVGCDGGGSRVRRELGIGLDGAADVGRVYMIHFRSLARDLLERCGSFYHFQTSVGTLIAQNGRDIWTLHSPLPPGTDEETIDPAEIVRTFVGASFPFEILVANPWSLNLLVADRYRESAVFLAGDAAHQFIPTGGYGMNTGIGDAMDLGWKLSALVQGWGGEELAETYELERRPVALRNRDASAAHAEARIKIAMLIEAAGEVDGEGAEEARKNLSAQISAAGNAENESWGIEHGFRYDDSPIVAEDANDAAPPPFDPLKYVPFTYPGGRLPMLYRQDGTSLYDQLHIGFTLIVVGDASVGGFQEAAAALGIPFAMLLVSQDEAANLLDRPLILVRPDQHIAWHGDAAPDDCLDLLACAVGRRKQDV